MEKTDEISEILEQELTDAIAELVIDEEDDEQDELRNMILDLQIKAYERGLLTAQLEGSGSPYEAVLRSSSEEMTGVIASLLRDGSAKVEIALTE